MAPDSRGSDRTSTVYYNMKTSRPPTASSHSSHSHNRGHSHSQPHSHHPQSHASSQTYRPSKSSTPMASPRMPHSVGQPYPPKLSPGAAARVSAQAQEVRSPSPNYFGLVVEPAADPRDSSYVPRDNWSSPTSSVKSFGAAIPKQLPLDANPEFEAFRRQADANRGSSGFVMNSPHPVKSTVSTRHPAAGGGPPQLMLSRPPRWQHLHGSDMALEMPLARPLAAANANARDSRDCAASKMDVDADTNSLHDSAYVSADSKRNSEASLNPPSFLNMPRHESPAQFDSPFESRTQLSKVEDRHPRLSVSQGKSDLPVADAGSLASQRSETVPAKLESGGPTMMSPAQLKEIIGGPAAEALLLLDVRVATHYAVSRIKGALNLCIPTTLLKRATFNLQKLQLTFQDPEEQGKFASWRDRKFLVVYDSASTEKRDAVGAMNMLKKFTNEGYSGHASVLRGGFNHFAAAYPHLIDHKSSAERAASPSSFSLGADTQKRPSLPPVIGGVALPNGSSNPNPFFSNIRQNMDLADGVGQMDISIPANLDPTGLPRWLRETTETSDHGKRVSDRFLNIELAEQARMRKAYSVINPAMNASSGTETVQLSGVEKGVKNRYKDILPFEHARVRLQGRPEGACDYVNASHIKASRSHKRYIASQGPLPATFEDFWSMIWDQDVRVIVMLTAESEGGQLKCHPYWTSKEFGSIRLRSLSEKKVSLDIDKHRSQSTISSISSDSNPSIATPRGTSVGEQGRRRANTTTTFGGATPTPSQPSSNSSSVETPFVIIRKFALAHTAHPFAPIREITHLHYPSWPDFGAPAQPSHLLALVELANVMQRASLPIDVPSAIAEHGSLGRSASSTSSSSGKTKTDPIPITWHDVPEPDPHARPMLVHCSAGCGRTGTFCTVDSVIDMLKRRRMFAVKRANASMAAKERRIREMQGIETDAEGDISMDEVSPTEELVSPLASFVESPTLPRELSTPFPGLADDTDETLSSADGEGLETAWLDDDSVDIVAKTVEDFRTQRISMVQSLRQFVLCYETVAEWVWRLQERAGGGGNVRGRARSGSMQVRGSN